MNRLLALPKPIPPLVAPSRSKPHPPSAGGSTASKPAPADSGWPRRSTIARCIVPPVARPLSRARCDWVRRIKSSAVQIMKAAPNTATAGCATRSRSNTGDSLERSRRTPSISEVEGNSVSPKAVTAPVTLTMTVANAAQSRLGAALRILNRSTPPLASQAMIVIAASNSIVLVKCAERYQTRPADWSCATLRNTTNPAPSNASMNRNPSEASAYRLAICPR